MRPIVHFTAGKGWINDPHGITYHSGEYHMFFQFVPGRTTWAPNCHWGHATGPDLLSWTEQPIALAPGEGDDGIWTGSLVLDDEQRARIFYTATSQPDIGIGRIRVATSEDDQWMQWTKGDVVAQAPAGLDIIAYRDPFLLRDSDRWRMFVGAGAADGTAMALSYTSEDLNTWSYEGIALERNTRVRDQVWMGALWECPQIFDVDGRAVMVSSVWDDDVLHHAGYAIGAYHEGRFEAETWGRLTFGESYYAPSFFRDAAGQPCLTFWMRGIADEDAGWASAHSVPHRLRLDGDVLVAEPHPDLLRRRGPQCVGGHVDSLAADIEWDGIGELSVASGGAEVFRMRSAGAECVISIGGAEASFPARGPVRVLVDAQSLEVSSHAGIFGAAIAPTGDSLDVTGGAARVFLLR